MTDAGQREARIEMGGNRALVSRMRAPLMTAMAGRLRYYAVRIEGVGPGGHVLVSITGSKGRLPLLFGPHELQAAHISRVVRGALDEAAL